MAAVIDEVWFRMMLRALAEKEYSTAVVAPCTIPKSAALDNLPKMPRRIITAVIEKVLAIMAAG